MHSPPTPDDSSELDEKKLQLVKAISRLVGPIEQVLERQMTLQGQLEAAAALNQQVLRLLRLCLFFLLLGCTGVAGSLYLQHRRGVAAEAAFARQERAIQEKLSTTPNDVAGLVLDVSQQVKAVQTAQREHDGLGGHPQVEARVRRLEQRLGIAPPSTPAQLEERVRAAERELAKPPGKE